QDAYVRRAQQAQRGSPYVVQPSVSYSTPQESRQNLTIRASGACTRRFSADNVALRGSTASAATAPIRSERDLDFLPTDESEGPRPSRAGPSRFTGDSRPGRSGARDAVRWSRTAFADPIIPFHRPRTLTDGQSVPYRLADARTAVLRTASRPAVAPRRSAAGPLPRTETRGVPPMSTEHPGVERLRPTDPETIGPYRLLGRLGEGGMGTVYLALAP